IAAAFPAVVELAKQIAIDVKAGHFVGRPAQAMDVVRKFTSTTARTASIAVAASALERDLVGKPTDILSVDGTGEPMSLEDFKREVTALGNVLAREERLADADGRVSDVTKKAGLCAVNDGGMES